MTAVAFYHLEIWPLEKALPKLLEKTLAADRRAVVMASSEQRIGALDSLLWTFDREAWLPHGSGGDAPEDQPVWLTARDENPNRAHFLSLTDGAVSEHVGAFERCFELFDGTQPAAVEAARARWRTYEEAGHDLTYWRQTERGGWEKGTVARGT